MRSGRLRLFVPSLALALAATCGLPAARADFAVDLGTTINGSNPVGNAPFLTATFETVSSNKVLLTLETGGLTLSTEKVDAWLFNFDPSLSLSGLTFTSTSGPKATVTVGSNNFGNNQNVSGFGNNRSGLFDIKFDWPSSASDPNTFFAGMTSTYTITYSGPGTLTASSFTFSSAPNFNAGGPYVSAAHVQGFGGGQSGAIAGSKVRAVPEPSSLALVGLGVAVLPLARRLRRMSRVPASA